MNDRLKDELNAMLSALEADGTAAPSRLTDALSDAVAVGRSSLAEPDTVDIAALLDGTLEEADRAALIAALAGSGSARADLVAADDLLQSVSQAPGRAPAAVLAQARAVLTPPAAAPAAAGPARWWSTLGAPRRRWELALGAVAGLVALAIILPPLMPRPVAVPAAEPGPAALLKPQPQPQPQMDGAGAPTAAPMGEASAVSLAAAPAAAPARPARPASPPPALVAPPPPPPRAPAPSLMPTPAPPMPSKAMAAKESPSAAGRAERRLAAVSDLDEACPPAAETVGAVSTAQATQAQETASRARDRCLAARARREEAREAQRSIAADAAAAPAAAAKAH